MVYFYKVFGCHFACDFRLGLPLANAEGHRPINDHMVRVCLHDPGPPPPWVHDDPASIRVAYRILALDVGVIDVRRGASVDIYPLPGVDESILEMWLMGITMTTLMFQRGYFVLHACAMRIGQHTVGLIGNIGAGKSTLTASLLARGHQFLADDLLVLDCVQGVPSVLTGFPLLKLSDAVAGKLGISPDRALSRHPYKGKSIYRVESMDSGGGYPLDHLFLLDRGSLEFIRMPAIDAFAQLNRHSVPTRWGYPSDLNHFEQCSRVCKNVPFTIYRRPFNLDDLDVQARNMERFLENGLDAWGPI
jgi:hypothetical protein